MIRRPCPISPLSPEDDAAGHYFFGYYDRCPWNADGSLVLAHRAPFLDRFPGADDRCEIGVIDTRTRRFHRLADTRAWNWQQGAQLQWLPSPRAGVPADRSAAGEERSPPLPHQERERPSAARARPGEGRPPPSPRAIFNDRRNGRPVAIILDAAGTEHAVLDHPIYALSPDGRTALTLNYARLAACRFEYGYPGLDDPTAAAPAPADDGVYRLDLATGRRDLLVPIARAAAHRENPMGRDPGAGPHYVNHLMFNVSGTRFSFLHRFERADGITHSRLFTCAIDGSDLRLLIEGMVSHSHWRDDDSILAWAGRRRLLDASGPTGEGRSGAGGQGEASGNGRGDGRGDGRGGGRGAIAAAAILARRTLKPIYYAMGKPRFLMSRILKDSYLLIPDAEAGGVEPRVFARGELTCDGHCTFNRGGDEPARWVLTDGYPDLRSRQPLFLWDCRTSTGYEIGRYSTPRRLDGPTRVDLHPRFNHDATSVCIDSAMDGRRRMYTVDVSGITRGSP